MPFVPRLFIKTGIAYLALTFIMGAVLFSLEAVGRPVPYMIGVEHGHMGFVVEPINASSPTAPTRTLLLIAALLQAAAVLVIARIAWSRVYRPALRPDV